MSIAYFWIPAIAQKPYAMQLLENLFISATTNTLQEITVALPWTRSCTSCLHFSTVIFVSTLAGKPPKHQLSMIRAALMDSLHHRLTTFLEVEVHALEHCSYGSCLCFPSIGIYKLLAEVKKVLVVCNLVYLESPEVPTWPNTLNPLTQQHKQLPSVDMEGEPRWTRVCFSIPSMARCVWGVCMRDSIHYYKAMWVDGRWLHSIVGGGGCMNTWIHSQSNQSMGSTGLKICACP